MQQYLKITENTEDSPLIETPNTFKKPLYEYQRADAYKIIELQKSRYITTLKGYIYRDVCKENTQAVISSACVLSEPYGSGKTIIVLAVIASCPRLEPYVVQTSSIIGVNLSDAHRERSERFKGFCNEIVTTFNRVINCSIIVVGHSVLRQWEDRIKEFTSLTVFMLSNKFQLIKFYDMYKDGSINQFDIVLVKNSPVTGHFLLDGELLSKTPETRPIIDVVSKIMGGDACQWLIYDDFDVIKTPSGVRGLNGLYTIYVSASRKKPDYAPRDRHVTYGSVSEMIAVRAKHQVISAVYDNVIFNNFNVVSNKRYIEESTNLPIYHIYRYVYKNPNDRYMMLLGKMGTADATLIMEALNSDAVTTAATALGINADPHPSSIFQKVLDKEWDKYEKNCHVLDIISAFRDHIAIADLEPHPKEWFAFNELEAIKNKIIKYADSLKGKKQTDINITEHIPMKYYAENINKYLDELEVKYMIEKQDSGKAINNIKDNIKEGDCPVCCMEFEDIVITKCCNLAICGSCLRGAFQLRIGNKRDGSSIVGLCANCKHKIDITSDIVYVTKIDADSILNSTGMEKEPEPEPEPEQEQEVEKTEEDEFLEKNPKLAALYAVIKGETPKKQERCYYDIKNLLQGIRDIPADEDTIRKVLVYSGYDEALDTMRNFLEERGIKVIRMGVTFNDIHRDIAAFKESDVSTVLLVNSRQTCSGTDIQFATDLVFFHKLKDRDIEGQIAGRMQRVGRKYNFNIHYLTYNNEQTMF